MDGMIKLKVKNVDNKEVGEIELPKSVYDTEVNEYLISFAVKHFLATERAGTASTKVKHEVSGSGRKLWRQKGTGRARVGMRRNPVWKGGGVVFGPRPRSFTFHLPKKMKKKALQSALTQKVKDNRLTIIDKLALEKPKTKELGKIMTGLGLAGKILVVDNHDNRNLMLSARNNPDMKMVGWSILNVFDLLKYDHLILSANAASSLGEVLSR